MAARKNPLHEEEPEGPPAPEPTGEDVEKEVARLDTADDEDPIPLDEPEEEPDAQEGEPQARPSKRRRGQAYKELEQRLEEERKAREQTEQRLQQIAQQSQQFQQQVFQRMQQSGDPQKDPREKEWEDALAAEDALVEEWNLRQQAGQITPDYEREFRKKVHQVRERQLDARLNMRQAQQPPQLSPQQQYVQQLQYQLAAEFPEVYQNQQAAHWTRGEIQKRMAMGEPLAQAARAAMTEARQYFYGKGGEPPASLRQKLQGPSRGAGGVGAPTHVARPRPGEPYYEMAVALYQDEIESGRLTEQQAVEKWVRGPGKAILQETG